MDDEAILNLYRLRQASEPYERKYRYASPSLQTYIYFLKCVVSYFRAKIANNFK